MWPADNIKKSRVDDLVPYARNARTHSDAQVAQIAASIKEWGWTTGGRTKGPSAIQEFKIRDSVFRVMRHKGGLGKAGKHPAVFPVDLPKEAIDAYTKAGDRLYEPFSGSGTTIIAGEMTGRHVYAIELNPAYVDVAVKRWQDFTGQDAIHEASGKTFYEMTNNKGIDHGQAA